MLSCYIIFISASYSTRCDACLGRQGILTKAGARNRFARAGRTRIANALLRKDSSLPFRPHLFSLFPPSRSSRSFPLLPPAPRLAWRTRAAVPSRDFTVQSAGRSLRADS